MVQISEMTVKKIIKIHKTAKPAFFLCANYCKTNIALYFPFGRSVNVTSQGGYAGLGMHAWHMDGQYMQYSVPCMNGYERRRFDVR